MSVTSVSPTSVFYMSAFDSLFNTMFDTVTKQYGDQATWTPSAGGAAQSASVLYNGPTEKEKLFSADYDPDKLTLEYKEGQFSGLMASVNGGTPEFITIENVGEFQVRGVQKLVDGKNYKAHLVLKTE